MLMVRAGSRRTLILHGGIVRRIRDLLKPAASSHTFLSKLKFAKSLAGHQGCGRFDVP